SLARRTWLERTTSTLSTTLELNGKMRSTPCPKLTLRTVKLPCGPPLREITVPSNACTRSLSPSLIFTWTRTLSPGTKGGMSLRLVLARSFSMIRFVMILLLFSEIVKKKLSKAFCWLLLPATCDLRRSDCWRGPADPGDCAKSSLKLFAGASGVSLRDYPKPALREPASRESPRAVCSAGNPAIHRMHKWNRDRLLQPHLFLR